jgi:hypothetical protein
MHDLPGDNVRRVCFCCGRGSKGYRVWRDARQKLVLVAISRYRLLAFRRWFLLWLGFELGRAFVSVWLLLE